MAATSALMEELRQINLGNQEWQRFCRIAMGVLHEFLIQYIRCYTNESSIEERNIVKSALQQPSVCYCLFRMYPDVFEQFVSTLVRHHRLKASRGVRHNDQVGMFLFTIAHGASQRLVAAIFGVSLSTVNEHIHRVLDATSRLSSTIIRPHPSYNLGAGYHTPNNPRHHAFRDCIGAIDGTHVVCVPPEEKKEAFYGRKGIPTQNIIAICDFNLCFTFASAGWEGSMHDSRVLRMAMEKYGESFPLPLGNKYYLVDAGYPHAPGFMAPFRGLNLRHHFQDFNNARTAAARASRTGKELFNYMHSSCRNVIERTFGVWKARFSVLHRMPSYDMYIQANLIMVTMAVHNFLRLNQANDAAFAVAMNNSCDTLDPDDEVDSQPSASTTSRRRRQEEWEERRLCIQAELMASNN